MEIELIANKYVHGYGGFRLLIEYYNPTRLYYKIRAFSILLLWMAYWR